MSSQTTDMHTLACDACRQLDALVHSHFCGAECIMVLQSSNEYKQALDAQLSLRSVGRIATNVLRELQRGNECALEALGEPDEPVVFVGARVRLVDVQRCVAATHAHMRDVCDSLARLETQLSTATSALCVQPAGPSFAWAGHSTPDEPMGSEATDETSKISGKRKCR